MHSRDKLKDSLYKVQSTQNPTAELTFLKVSFQYTFLIKLHQPIKSLDFGDSHFRIFISLPNDTHFALYGRRIFMRVLVNFKLPK